MLKRFQPSMVTKLMGLYALATLALLAALGFMLYPTFQTLLSQYAGQDASHVTIECYKQFIFTFLIGGIGALILGHFVAKQGLHKIHELKANMASISIDALDDRINLNEWPKELKPLGACYNDMLDRLQSAFIQLSQFSSDLAHELRHPIHNLKQITEIELTNPHLDASVKPLFLDYMQELNHLTKLIEQLLFLARSENSQIALNKETLAVRPLVKKLFEFYAALAQEKELTLNCEGDAQLLADPVLFQRLLNNILANAIEHALPQGSIMIHIGLTTNYQVQIAIHDTGVGIDPIHLPKLCNRLYRVDHARTPNQGLGLGLAIAKSIVELHQGEIEIQSSIDAGTSVYLRFPSEF
jgi:two-component system heavy metal sensor histidine kinase CusS